MLRKELSFNLLEVLKEVADRFSPVLAQKAGEVLKPRDSKLFYYVLKYFYQGERIKGRWYDQYHIPLGVFFIGKAVKLGQAPPESVQGFNFHDAGYAFIDPEFKIKGENKENLQVVSSSRILHMQKAAGPVAKILIESGDFNSEEICKIVDVVVSHDNGYLGLPIEEEPLLLAVRDADRTLVMHLISFYKDWLNVTNEREDFSLLDLFRSRIIGFYDVSDPAPLVWGKPEKLTKEDGLHTHRIPYTPLAREWRDRQFEARWQEIQIDILRNELSFRQYAEQHIRAEITAGRG